MIRLPEKTVLTTVRLLARRAPLDAHHMHRVIESVTRPGRTLWAQPLPDTLVLQTQNLPDWGAIPGATGATVTQAQHVHVVGSTVHWALIANPTKARLPAGHDRTTQTRGKRVGLDDTEVEAWARRKLGGALAVTEVQYRRLAPARGRGVTVSRFAFAGTGRVTDSARLTELCAQGVGHGKAFGCGLLVPARVEVAT